MFVYRSVRLNGYCNRLKTRNFSSSATLAKKPIHLQFKPAYLLHKEWTPTERFGWDGVPLEEPDDTPHDGTNRPKRKEARYQKTLDKTMKMYNTWEVVKQPPRESKDYAHPPAVPRIEPVIPEPRNGMTVERFLKTIGRDCPKYIENFTSWQNLFSTKGRKMKELGIDLLTRKYLLRWLEKYRQGVEPKYEPLKSRAHKHRNLQWRLELITQKDLRKQYGLE